MDHLFRHKDFVTVYVDEVVVLSRSVQERTKHLLEVLCVIADHGLKLKASKCGFAQSKVRLLGRIFDMNGVH